MENFFNMKSLIKKKIIGIISMIIGIIMLLFPMFLYTGVALMAETEPIVNVIIFLLLGCIIGPLIILSVIFSFFKKGIKIGCFGSMSFSFLFLSLSIYLLFSEIYSSFSFIRFIFLYLIFLSAPCLIISGASLRIFQNKKILTIACGTTSITIVVIVMFLIFILSNLAYQKLLSCY